ncbi:ABC transporter ATP-binding protein [Candidatus Auribacterota bacterium]
MEKILRAVDVFKEYRVGKESVEVLNGINFDIEQNDFVSILGASGVGKSTLLHILGALDVPSKGSVYFGDTDIYKLRDSKRAAFRNKKVGFVFQFYYLLPEFTAVENVTMPVFVSDGSSKKEYKQAVERAKRMLDDLGLGSRLNHRPRQLSGGEQQRVAIARALINEPAVLFADEPTGNLDRANGESIIELIMKLNSEKKQTTVIVTHDENLASRTKRIVRMFDGKIVKD